MRWVRAERGAAMVIVALALPVLLLLAGLALDLGRAHLLGVQLQTAVDAGALAGALQTIPRVRPPSTGTVAREALLLNAAWPGGSHGARLAGIDVAVDHVRATVKVTATLQVPTHFLRLIGIREMLLTRSATAAPVRRPNRMGHDRADRWGSKLID